MVVVSFWFDLVDVLYRVIVFFQVSYFFFDSVMFYLNMEWILKINLNDEGI